MQKIFRPLRAEISLDNIRHNYRVLHDMIEPDEFFCPMLKGNAYGHGDIEIARALSADGAHCFGVALIEEGIRLRDNGVTADLLVFQPYADHGDPGQSTAADAVVSYRLTPVISSWFGLRALEAAIKRQAHNQDIDVHLKFNTGMNRLGFAPSEAKKLRDYFADKSSKLALKGICTHLLAGDDALQEDGRTNSQLKIFSEICELFKEQKVAAHVLNSSALLARFLNRKRSLLSELGARPGISLYGVKAPVKAMTREMQTQYERIDLRPVMRVISEVVHIQKLDSGETVSYGGHFQVKRASTIGVVPIGYADGYMRRLSSKSKMVCRGETVPVAGTVCMDFSMIDLTDTHATIGDEVVVLGSQRFGEKCATVSSEELAEKADTISYEIFTNFSARVPRVYV